MRNVKDIKFNKEVTVISKFVAKGEKENSHSYLFELFGSRSERCATITVEKHIDCKLKLWLFVLMLELVTRWYEN